MDESMTIDELIHVIDPNPNFGLSYQNKILELNRPISHYKFKNNTLLYMCPVKRRTNLRDFVPDFAELEEGGNLMIPLLENLINQNTELLDSLNSGNRMNITVQFTSGMGYGHPK